MRRPAYKILILHAVEPATRKTVLDHIYCYPANRQGNIYVYHHLLAPVTAELVSFPFDAVIINYCFLAYRAVEEWYPELRAKYAFLADTAAVKIAIPQDDYVSSAVLDEWLVAMKVDVIYSAVSRDLAVLYPQCSASVPIKGALCGYSDQKELVRLKPFVLPFRRRAIDVGARVRYLPPWVGRAGVLKGRGAERFRDAAAKAGFTVDISTRREDVFVGDDWFRFLGSCRFTFVTKTGASLNDPRGAIRARVNEFLRENPDASFDEVEAACFPGLDGYDFSGVSPRLFEATAARTGLILLEDDYVDGLEPYRHYIPLKADFSNLDEVFALMRDDAAAEEMIEAAYQHLVASGRFDYAVLVDDVMAEIIARRPVPRPVSAQDFANLKRHCERCAATHWLLEEAPPHWSQIARLVGMQARQQGQLGSLACLVAGKPSGKVRSVMAAEMASGAHLERRLAVLAVESLAGLAGDQKSLNAWAGMLGDLSSRSEIGILPHDYRYCEYIYDPMPSPDGESAHD